MRTITLPSSYQNGLAHLSPTDAATFTARFATSGHEQQIHMQMELVVAAFGVQYGYAPEYEPAINGQTPDWQFKNRTGSQFIAEVLTFHMDDAIRKDMDAKLSKGQVWSMPEDPMSDDALPDSRKRLKDTVRYKASKYKTLIETVDLPYVICVYASSESFLHLMEAQSCLQGQPDSSFETHLRSKGHKFAPARSGEFKAMPHVSGVWFFEYQGGLEGPRYQFTYIRSSFATRPLDLPDGHIELPIPAPA
jgi:hypothetical protein